MSSTAGCNTLTQVSTGVCQQPWKHKAQEQALSIASRMRRVDGELVVRAYTPTSSDDDMGYFDLVIKARAPACAQPVKSLRSLKSSTTRSAGLSSPNQSSRAPPCAQPAHM